MPVETPTTYDLEQSQALYSKVTERGFKRLVPLDVRLNVRELAKIIRDPLPWVQRRWALQRHGVRSPALPRVTSSGFAWLPLQQMPYGPEVLSVWGARAWERKRELDLTYNPEKPHKRDLFPREELTRDPLIANFALSETLLSIVGNYLGSAPILHGVSLWLGRKGYRDAGSPYFHFDSQNWGNLRIYVYFSDVGEDSGPFCYIDRQASFRFMRRTGYLGNAIPDRDCFQVIPPERLVRVTGPAGTCFAIDTTRCLHYGSRCTSDDRIALILCYDTYYAKDNPSAFINTLPAPPTDSGPLRRLAMRHYWQGR